MSGKAFSLPNALPAINEFCRLICAYGMMLTVAWSPVPMGSYEPRYWLLLETMIFVLAVFYCLYKLTGNNRSKTGLRLIVLLMGVWLVFIFLQWVPLPASVLEILSLNAFHLYGARAEELNAYSLSLHRFATLQALIRYAAYVMVFVIVAETFRYQELRRAIFLLVGTGVLICFYGLARKFLTDNIVLTATFSSRNHFALFANAILSLLVGMQISNWRSGREGNDGAKRMIGFDYTSLFIYFCIVIVLASLLQSTSRGGLLSLPLGFLATLTMVFVCRRDVAQERALLPWLLLGVVVAVVWLGAQGMFGRLLVLNETLVSDERWTIWQASMRLFHDYWLFGVGAGAYEVALSTYKTGLFRPLGYDHAHNDYIEALCELGAIGSAILLSWVTVWYLTVLRRYRFRNDRFVRGVVFGALMYVSIMLIHSFFDFKFHIPANAIMFFMMLGIGYSAVSIDRRTEQSNQVKRRSSW